jgi:hypothetical protein
MSSELGVCGAISCRALSLDSSRSVARPAFFLVTSGKEQVLSISRYCALKFVEAERRGASGKE